MKFDDLQKIFNSHLSFSFRYSDDIDGVERVSGQEPFFEIKEFSGFIMIKVFNHDKEDFLTINDVPQSFVSKIKNLSIISDVILGHVAKEKDGVIYADVIGIPKIKNDDLPDFSVGLPENKKINQSYISDKYLINLNGVSYYVKGVRKFIAKSYDGESAESDAFAFVCPSNRLEVQIKSKGEAYPGITDDPGATILVCNESEAPWNNEDIFNLVLTKDTIYFSSKNHVEESNPATILNAKSGSAEMGEYLSIWQEYTTAENQYYDSIIESAPTIGLTYRQADHESLAIEFMTNGSSLSEFMKLAKKIDSNNPPVLVEEKFAGVVYNYDTSNGKIVIGFSSYLDLSRIQRQSNNSTKPLSLSINGKIFEASNKRKIRAIELIVNKKTQLQNLSDILEGTATNPFKRQYSIIPDPETLMDSFDGLMPTDNQLEAIKMALNTPDIAIIQGPPGTGKTSVIKAIEAVLAKNTSDKELKFGKFLATAYQHVATENLAKRITGTFGIPWKPYEGGLKKQDNFSIVKEWIENTRSNIEKLDENNKAVELSKSMSFHVEFFGLATGYSPETFTCEDDELFLDRLLKLGDDFFNDKNDNLTNQEKLKTIYETVLRKVRQEKEVQGLDYRLNTLKLYYLDLIPLNEISYGDGGPELVKNCLEVLEMDSQMRPLSEKLRLEFDKADVKYIQFDRVKILVDKAKSLFLNNQLIIPFDLNQEIEQQLDDISEKLHKHTFEDDPDGIIANYLVTMKYHQPEVVLSCKDFVSTLCSTHQMVGSSVLSDREDLSYDTVIVDEAARSSPNDLFIPLSRARNQIILVGDQNQLPQLINDQAYEILDARDKKMTPKARQMLRETMFEHLMVSAQNLTAIDGIKRVIRLTDVFRMPSKLTDFISRNFYQKDLSGNKIADSLQHRGADKVIDVPFFKNKPMMFVDVNAIETKDGTSWKNEGEAKRIARIIDYVFKNSDTFKTTKKGPTIAVLSFYLAQVTEIKKALENYGITGMDNGESDLCVKNSYKNVLKIDTVDSFQGQEADVTILSIVRNNKSSDQRTHFGFVANQNRLCVALSRARANCIVVGNSKVLQSKNNRDVEALVDFYDTCKKEGCVVEDRNHE